ncbi:MAG TPA: DUF885 domain-containing protein [Chthoniobacterales bacterium]|nr:DUF885 domain-containing protein [Chthoniobacterales bacterium]
MKIARMLIALVTLALSHHVRATPADDEFQKLASEYIEARLRTYPEDATELGDHRFDDKLTDYSKEARAKELAAQKDFLARLNAFKNTEQLTGANSVDFRILKDNVEGEIFSLEELKSAEWNPLTYNQSLANGIYLLIAREFAPAEQRIPNIRKRMEGIPRVIEQAKANLKNPPRIYTETAIEQTQGAITFIRDGLAPVLDRMPEMKKDIAPVQEKTATALEDYKKWLQGTLLPKSQGDFRLGADKFRRKLRYSLASDLSMEEIMKRARADLAATQAAIYETALPLYKQYFPDADPAIVTDKKKVTTAVLDKLAEERPHDDTIVNEAKKVVVEATDFVREKDLVTVPTEPLDVIVMPEFKRGQGIAYCDSPGPLEKNGETFYAIEPTPASWSPERKDSFFREYNDYMLRDLTVHEATPGHYLQLMHANRFRGPTLVRAIFRSGTFIEGWGVYAEQFMAEAGYGGPEVKMQQLKMRLRVICNAILDQSIHTAGMSEQQALDLMMKEGFQQEGEAVAKWKRARLSSAQLSTYFVGTAEHLDLRDRAKAKLGGGFDLKKYNDTVLSFGSPPAKYVRELMGL